MKVAVVSPYALDRPGGVQKQAAELVDQLRGRGHDSLLIGPGRTGPGASRSVGRATPVPANRAIAPISLDPRVPGRLRVLVAGFDIVHVHEPLIPLVGWSTLTLGVPPVVGTFHADPPGWITRLFKLLRPAVRRVLSRLAGATAVSPVASTAVEELVEGLRIVPNAIDVSAYSSGTKRGRRVAFLGRDEPRKGLSVLLDAWPHVADTHPDAELVVLGAERRSALPRVRFVGPLGEAEKREELSEASVLCAPNLGGESFGLSVLEGMASGCALVVSDIPAFRHLVGDAGRFVPPGQVEALATSLVEVLAAPARVRDLGGLARVRAGDFDWARVVPRYEGLYQDAIR